MIGIISDTHDQVEITKKAIAILKKKKADVVLHCGDVIAPLTLKLFNGLKLKLVQGNCDGDLVLLKKFAEEQDSEFLGKSAELEIEGKKIFFTHKPEEAEAAAKSGKFDYIFHGHVHEKRDEMIGKTRLICPGGFYPGATGYVVLIDKDKVEFIEVK
jgi:putative phosphoesterase